MARDFQAWQEVVVEGRIVRAIHPDGDGDIRVQTCIEPDDPAPPARCSLLAPCNDKRGGELIVYREKVIHWMSSDAAALRLDLRHCGMHRLPMKKPQGTIDFDVTIVPRRKKTFS